MIKAIIFDYAGVIVTDAYWVLLVEKIPNIEGERKYFDTLSEDVDIGKISHQEFLKKLSEKTNWPADSIWEEVKKRAQINKELLDYILVLKKKYKIGLLSNFTGPWIREFINANNLSRYFDDMVISSEVKMIKPDKRIFELALDKLKVDKSEAVFIDDRKGHVEFANSMGIRSFVYVGVSQLEKDLKTLGV